MGYIAVISNKYFEILEKFHRNFARWKYFEVFFLEVSEKLKKIYENVKEIWVIFENYLVNFDEFGRIVKKFKKILAEFFEIFP